MRKMTRSYGGHMNTPLAEQVSRCTTYGELLRAALYADEANHPPRKGLYAHDWRFISGRQLNNELKLVREGEVSLHRITRNYGFRDKANELLANSSRQDRGRVA